MPSSVQSILLNYSSYHHPPCIRMYKLCTVNTKCCAIQDNPCARVKNLWWILIIYCFTYNESTRKGLIQAWNFFPYNHNTLISFNLMSIIPIIYGCILLALLTPWSHIRKMNMCFIWIVNHCPDYVRWCYLSDTLFFENEK